MKNKDKWLLWNDSKHFSYFNMAADEKLLEQAEKLNKIIIRFYFWRDKAATIGYIQKYSAAPNDYTIIRRPTGGGVVFHDKDLTYTVAVPGSHKIYKLDRTESYHIFHRAILKALKYFKKTGDLAPDLKSTENRQTVKCFTSPTKYDIIVGTKKIAGAAQRRTKSGILHQGSILKEVADGNVEALQESMIYALQREFNIEFDPFVPDELFIEETEKLAEEKYHSASWNKKRE